MYENNPMEQLLNIYCEENLKNFGNYPFLKAYISAYLLSTEFHFDTDVCIEAIKFYKNNWDFLNDFSIQNRCGDFNKSELKKQLYKKDEYLVYGDVLNSMKHIFSDFLNKYCAQLPDNSKYYSKKWKNKDYKTILIEFDSLFSEANLRKVEWATPILEQFELFAKNNDTYGNLFPCPPQFNSERSNYGKHDFCDIFLNAIYNYLSSNKNEKCLEDLFCGVQDIDNYPRYNHIKNSVRNLKHFLRTYYNNDWNIFVEKNHFQYYVNYNNNTQNYEEPKKLWSNHSLQNTDYPQIGEEYYEMLRFINKGIIARNKSFKISGDKFHIFYSESDTSSKNKGNCTTESKN